MKSAKLFTRREAIGRGLTIAASAALLGLPLRLLADELSPLDVAYAGSMGSLMEGPLKSSAAQALKLELHGRAQGSSALAQLIAGGSIRPDVFISVTSSPMLTVLRAGKAAIAQPVARTEMVIAYSPRSRFAARLQAAAEGKARWWEALQEPGLRFGRTDPVTDPQGRNIIFTMLLAATLYKQSGLAEKILGPVINQQQIFTEPTVQARLQSGELDAASAYKTQPGPFNLPYIALPREVNLGRQNVHTDHPEISLSINGKTYQPEPLIFYAAALNDAPNPKGAAAFVDWLRGAEAQAIFSRFNYDPPGNASPLRA
ncbi:MAG TPA: extracellular solute-binding protein [Candidatus Angelobacter sp.]|nr:extracellular solute-binding protein [Candidatus Angelobacter sp.]